MSLLKAKNLSVSVEETVDVLGNRVCYIYLDAENASENQERELQRLGEYSAGFSSSDELTSARIMIPLN